MKVKGKRKRLLGACILLIMAVLAVCTVTFATTTDRQNANGSYSLVIEKAFDSEIGQDVLKAAQEETYVFKITGTRGIGEGKTVKVDETVTLPRKGVTGEDAWRSEEYRSEGPFNVTVTEITDNVVLQVGNDYYNMSNSSSDTNVTVNNRKHEVQLRNNSTFTIVRPSNKSDPDLLWYHVTNRPYDEHTSSNFEELDEVFSLRAGSEKKFTGLSAGRYTIEQIAAPDGYQIQMGTRTETVAAGKTGHFHINGTPGTLALTSGGTKNDGATHYFTIERTEKKDESVFETRTISVASQERYVLDNLPKGGYTVTEYSLNAETEFSLTMPWTDNNKRKESSSAPQYSGFRSFSLTEGTTYIVLDSFGPLYDANKRRINDTSITYNFSYGVGNENGNITPINITGNCNATGIYTLTNPSARYPKTPKIAFRTQNVSSSTAKYIDVAWTEYFEKEEVKSFAEAGRQYTNGITIDDRGWMTISAPPKGNNSSSIVYYYMLRDSKNNLITGVGGQTDDPNTTVMLKAGESVTLNGLDKGSYTIMETVEGQQVGFTMEVSGYPFGTTEAGKVMEVQVGGKRDLTISKPALSNPPDGTADNRTYVFAVSSLGFNEEVKVKAGERKTITLPKEGNYTITPMDDKMDEYELGYTDSGAVYGTLSGSTGVVTFTNSFDIGEYGYRFVHEYYVREDDGTYTYEGNSQITTRLGRPEGEHYEAFDISQAPEFNGNHYKHFDEAYGDVDGIPSAASVQAESDAKASESPEEEKQTESGGEETDAVDEDATAPADSEEEDESGEDITVPSEEEEGEESGEDSVAPSEEEEEKESGEDATVPSDSEEEESGEDATVSSDNEEEEFGEDAANPSDGKEESDPDEDTAGSSGSKEEENFDEDFVARFYVRQFTVYSKEAGNTGRGSSDFVYARHSVAADSGELGGFDENSTDSSDRNSGEAGGIDKDSAGSSDRNDGETGDTDKDFAGSSDDNSGETGDTDKDSAGSSDGNDGETGDTDKDSAGSSDGNDGETGDTDKDSAGSSDGNNGETGDTDKDSTDSSDGNNGEMGGIDEDSTESSDGTDGEIGGSDKDSAGSSDGNSGETGGAHGGSAGSSDNDSKEKGDSDEDFADSSDDEKDGDLDDDTTESAGDGEAELANDEIPVGGSRKSRERDFDSDGIVSKGTGVDSNDKTLNYEPDPEKDHIDVTKDASQIIILRYYRDRKPKGTYNVIHVYYFRDENGDLWEGTSGVLPQDGELGVKYTGHNVHKEYHFQPADAKQPYVYNWDGRPQYGIVGSSDEEDSENEFAGNGMVYRPNNDWTQVEGTEEGNQIIILRYYRELGKEGSYNIVHEYYYREDGESLEEDETTSGHARVARQLSGDSESDEGEDDVSDAFVGTLNRTDGIYTFEGRTEIESVAAPLKSIYTAESVAWKLGYNGNQYAYIDSGYGTTSDYENYSCIPSQQWAASTTEGDEVIILRYVRGAMPEEPETPPKTPWTPPGGGGGGGGGGDTPRKEPETPPKTQETPSETPQYPTELPDPNDPDSPERITIMVNGVPTTYVKRWDPEKGEWVYIPENESPLAGLGLPRTGDGSRIALWMTLAAGSLCGLVILSSSSRKRRDK